MKANGLYVVVAVLSLAAAPLRTIDPIQKDLASLQGTWIMTELEVNGQTVPEEKIKGTTLTIRDDKYIVKVKKSTHETTFKIDPTKTPRAIDMFFPDGPNLPKLSKGVYELDGDTFKLCRHQMPGEDRPTQIGSWPDTNLFVVTWTRKGK